MSMKRKCYIIRPLLTDATIFTRVLDVEEEEGIVTGTWGTTRTYLIGTNAFLTKQEACCAYEIQRKQRLELLIEKLKSPVNLTDRTIKRFEIEIEALTNIQVKFEDE